MLSFSSADLVEGSVGTSSKGNQRKWRTRDGRYYIKECFSYQGKNWRDDMVELVATTYAQQPHRYLSLLRGCVTVQVLVSLITYRRDRKIICL